MMDPAPMQQVAYDYKSAGRATGYSEDVIRRAVNAGELTPHYPTSKPVILADDLREWVRRAPTERPKS